MRKCKTRKNIEGQCADTRMLNIPQYKDLATKCSNLAALRAFSTTYADDIGGFLQIILQSPDIREIYVYVTKAVMDSEMAIISFFHDICDKFSFLNPIHHLGRTCRDIKTFLGILFLYAAVQQNFSIPATDQTAHYTMKRQATLQRDISVHFILIT